MGVQGRQAQGRLPPRACRATHSRSSGIPRQRKGVNRKRCCTRSPRSFSRTRSGKTEPISCVTRQLTAVVSGSTSNVAWRSCVRITSSVLPRGSSICMDTSTHRMCGSLAASTVPACCRSTWRIMSIIIPIPQTACAGPGSAGGVHSRACCDE